MSFRARLMAWLNFSDLAESNDVPHAQIGEVSRFCSPKCLGYSPCFLGGWGTEPDSNFYAWNRCLEVPGVSSCHAPKSERVGDLGPKNPWAIGRWWGVVWVWLGGGAW